MSNYDPKASIYGQGEIKLDDDLLATVPKNRIITIKFKACPESVDKIVDKMLEDFISGPDYYSLVGVAGNSCVGWANEVLQSAGISPPIGGLISTPGWASQVQPTSGTIIGISF